MNPIEVQGVLTAFRTIGKARYSSSHCLYPFLSFFLTQFLGHLEYVYLLKVPPWPDRLIERATLAYPEVLLIAIDALLTLHCGLSLHYSHERSLKTVTSL